MFAALRARLSRGLMIASLDLTNHPITVEGVAVMDILTRLKAVEDAVATLQQAPATDTSSFATKADVAAATARLDAIDAEIGASSVPAPVASPAPVDPAPVDQPAQ